MKSCLKHYILFLVIFVLLLIVTPAASDEDGSNKKVKKRKVRKKRQGGPSGATIEEAMANAEMEREEEEKRREMEKPEKKTTHFSRFDDLNVRDLEKAWMEDDDEEFIRSDFDLLQDEIDRRKREGPNLADFMSEDGTVNNDDMQKILQQQKMGPSMMFANLGDTNPHSKEEWDLRTFEELTRKWSGLLLSGGHDDVSVFNMGEGYSKILIQIQKGWRSYEILDFLLSQPECKFVTWDNQDYYPEKRHRRDEL